ncbi:hypothetical protein [Granulicoccus sp. GXG6511]
MRDSPCPELRAATDSGVRTDLDTAIDAFGLDRAELADDLAAGRE